MAFIRADLDEYIAGLPEVNRAVLTAAHESANKIRAAAPVDTGRLVRSISVHRANGKDYWVSVDVPYVVPVEFGFFHVFAQHHITGQHFMRAGM